LAAAPLEGNRAVSVDGDISASSEILLWTAARARSSIREGAPAVGCRVGPLKDALVAGHPSWQHPGRVPVPPVPSSDHEVSVSIWPLQKMLFKAVLFWVLMDIVPGAEPEVEMSLVVGSDVNGNIKLLTLFVFLSDVSIGIASTRGLMGPRSIIRVSTDATLSAHLLVLVSRSSAEALVVIVVRGVVKPNSPLRGPGGWVHHSPMTINWGQGHPQNSQKNYRSQHV